MCKLFLFNPENDTALGVDSETYTPPKAAMDLHIDGSLLPLWWAEEGDYILSPKVENALYLKQCFGLKGTVIKHVTDENITECVPWGWSKDARNQFIKVGVNPVLMPDNERLAMLRQLSHRRVTIEINRYLSENLGGEFKDLIPNEITAISELPDYECFIKQPWSSSGRGVMNVNPYKLTDKEKRNIDGMLQGQGSLLVERALDKVQDFAMLFYCTPQRCEFKTLSIFNTAASGSYTGNLVASIDYKLDILGRYLKYQLLEKVLIELEGLLYSFYGRHYTGWIGVDMMVYRNDDGKFCLAPSIEVNMRMTMGVVAKALELKDSIQQYLPGFFSVKPAKFKGGNEIAILPEGRFSFTLSPIET